MPVRVRTRVTKSHRLPDGAIEEQVSEAMLNAAGAGFERSQVLVPYGATGDLQRSGFGPEVDADGNVEWGYDAPHAAPVEFGSRPHWIPMRAMPGLIRWAQLVLQAADPRSAAFAVRQKIAQEGTPAQPFVRPGILVQRVVLKGTGVATYLRQAFEPNL